MAKSFQRNLSSGLDSLVNNLDQEAPAKAKAKPGRKKTNNKVISKTSQEGTREGETRATFIVVEDSLEKVKNIAYWERLDYKEVVNEAFTEYIARYEKKNGPVKERPVKSQR